MNRIAEELADYDNQVKEILITDDEISTDNYTTETDSIDEYLAELETAVTKIKKALHASAPSARFFNEAQSQRRFNCAVSVTNIVQ